MENIYTNIDGIQKVHKGFNEVSSLLDEFIKSKYKLDLNVCNRKEIQMPGLADTRSQGGIFYVENFLNHINGVFDLFIKEFNSEIETIYYCYGEIYSDKGCIISSTLTGFNEFIKKNSGDHTLFYGYLILKNGTIIKINDDGTTYFDNYCIYN